MRNFKARLSLFLVFLMTAPSSVFAADDTAHQPVITRVEGEAQLFTQPSKSKTGQPPHALFDGMYYSVSPAKVRTKLMNGTIVQTAVNSKVRLVYPNGDLFTIGASTSFRIHYEHVGGKTETGVDVLFGKLRTFIVKGGPRQNLKVKTREAVMGVRGTDFFVASFAGALATTLSVLRGTVAISRSETMPPVEVPSGKTATVEQTPPPAPVETGAVAPAPKASPPIAVEAMDRGHLLAIQTETLVKKPNIGEGDVKDLEALETQSAQATVEDIKKTDPELYKSIASSGAKLDSVDAVQTATVKKLYEKAPKPKIPSTKEGAIKDQVEDVYKKYFNVE